MTTGPVDPFAGLVDRPPDLEAMVAARRAELEHYTRPLPPGPPRRRAQEPPAPPSAPLSRSEQFRAREAAKLTVKALEALELMARARTRPPGTAELAGRTGTSTGTNVLIHHGTAHRLAAAGYVTIRHDTGRVRLTPAGTVLIMARRGRLWPVARWSANIVDLDGQLDRWALAVARALLADEPAPAWPGRWRATGAARVATVRKLLGLEDPMLELEREP